MLMIVSLYMMSSSVCIQGLCFLQVEVLLMTMLYIHFTIIIFQPHKYIGIYLL